MTIEVPAGTGRLALARCVGDIDAFVADYWGQAPLLRKGSDVDNYGDLFSLSDIDYLVTSTALRYPSFRLAMTGFSRALELEPTHPTQTNVSVTPPSSRALGAHYDTHDVFVLQVAGRKKWQVFKRLLAYPLQTQKSPRVADPGPPLL